MNWKKEFVTQLRSEFKDLQKRDPKTTLRSFARRLKISPSAMSELLSKEIEWNLSPERAAEMATLLPCSEEKQKRLLALIGHLPPEKRNVIELKDYDILTHPAYAPIVSCFDLPKVEQSFKRIAARLNISESEVEEAVVSLIDKGYLRKDPDTGEILRNPVSWRAGDGPSNEIINSFHKLNLDFAQQAIGEIPSPQRHFSALTFSGNLSQLESLREEFRHFSEKIKSLMCDGQPKDEVFRFSINLYPIRNLPREMK